uniref:Uncharacterized protein n=1 Tax=Peronospora matthiolae TaxID=2874970 RepID=A0AAV1VGG9_9STRA
MDVSAKYQHWMAESHWRARDSFTVHPNRAADAAPPSNSPVLPRIASLLMSAERSDDRETKGTRSLSVAGVTGGNDDDRIYWKPSKLFTGLQGINGWRSSSYSAARTSNRQLFPSDVPAVSSVMRPDVYQELGSRGDTCAASTTHAPLDAAVFVSRVDQLLPQSSLDVDKRGRPISAESSPCSLPQIPVQPMLLGSPTMSQERDFAGCRRLNYPHSIDPLTIQSLAKSLLIPAIHQDSPLVMKQLRTTRDFFHQVAPPYVNADHFSQVKAHKVRTSVTKRRRVVTPDTTPCQPSDESEYGQAVSKTSKALKRSRCSHDTGPAKDSDLTALNVRGNSERMEKFDSRIKVGSHLRYSRDEEVATDTATATETPALALSIQPNVKKCEPSPHSTMAFDSKDLLTSAGFVRNRHGEVDWVATFLDVGFDSSSIYALMCPLRKGRWKLEEERYTLGLLQLIENGTILLRHGQSIRGYIGEKLHSDDMRVLKKLSNCKMFHFAKLINPRLAEKEDLDVTALGAHEGLKRLDRLRGEFLRSVQLEALVAVRKHLSDSSLCDLLSARA